MEHYTKTSKKNTIIFIAENGYRMDFGEGTYPTVRYVHKDIAIPPIRTITEEEYEAIAAANSVTNEEALYGHQF